MTATLNSLGRTDHGARVVEEWRITQHYEGVVGTIDVRVSAERSMLPELEVLTERLNGSLSRSMSKLHALAPRPDTLEQLIVADEADSEPDAGCEPDG